jgi:hypothetical protein
MDLTRGASDEMSAGWLPCPWPSSLPEIVFWPSEAPIFFYLSFAAHTTDYCKICPTAASLD